MGRPPLPNIFERKKNKGKLYIILKGIYQKFRINLNRKIIKFTILRVWSQKSRSGEIGENFKVFFWYDVMKSGSIRQ